MKRSILSLIVLNSIFSANILAELTKVNGVVIDSDTGLEWQDDYSDNSEQIKKANWSESINYCQSLTLNGGEWRLPNTNELLSLVDYNKYRPSIKSSTFENILPLNYWTSTTSFSKSGYAKYIDFNDGRADGLSSKSANNLVRCVRSTQ